MTTIDTHQRDRCKGEGENIYFSEGYKNLVCTDFFDEN